MEQMIARSESFRLLGGGWPPHGNTLNGSDQQTNHDLDRGMKVKVRLFRTRADCGRSCADAWRGPLHLTFEKSTPYTGFPSEFRLALHILKRMLVSNTPLTDVFLPKTEALEDAFYAVKLSPEDIAIDKKDSSKKMSVTLLISESKNKVLYAEATNDFLDILFSFLTFPLGSIVKLLGPGSSIRCLDNLYRSVEDLSRDDNCIISEECRAMLLDPKLVLHSGCENQLLPIMEAGPKTIDTSETIRCTFCGGDGNYYHNRYCSLQRSLVLRFRNPKLSDAASESGGGFLKQSKTTFMITDGLDVKPLSFISAISILARLNLPISDVQERVVSVGEEEALSLLKAAVFSRTVLSDVFCQKKVNQSDIKLERE